MKFWEVEILGVDISGVDILGVDILGRRVVHTGLAVHITAPILWSILLIQHKECCTSYNRYRLNTIHVAMGFVSCF